MKITRWTAWSAPKHRMGVGGRSGLADAFPRVLDGVAAEELGECGGELVGVGEAKEWFAPGRTTSAACGSQVSMRRRTSANHGPLSVPPTWSTGWLMCAASWLLTTKQAGPECRFR